MIHHIAGLPEASVLEETVGDGDWTSDFVVASLREMPTPPHVPGAAHLYSNAGYVLLARIVEALSGQSFSVFATDRLFAPHGLSGMRYVTAVDPLLPQFEMLGPPLPLSVGDGGLWSSAPAFARWLHLLNQDVFGIDAVVTAVGRIADAAVDYGWGIGLRAYNGRPLYLHGGSWSGAVARAARMPTLGVGVVALAASDASEALTHLVDATLEAVAGDAAR